VSVPQSAAAKCAVNPVVLQISTAFRTTDIRYFNIQNTQ